MTDTPELAANDPDGIRPHEIRNRNDLIAALKLLRSRSSLSFKALGAAINRPTTTVHGWFSGRHMPYQRDNADFEAMLRALGVAEVGPWMDALARCRQEANATGRENPYKGLSAYDEVDSPRFFGRDYLTERLVSVVSTPGGPTPVMVLGASGSGKTSLLRAGLTPALRSAGHAVAYMTPGDEPRARLHDAVAGLRAESSPQRVLIVDQLEEVLGLSDRPPGEFFAEMEAVTTECEVVIGLRSDFFHEAARDDWLIDGIKNRMILVSPPDGDDIPGIVTGPAESVGLSIDPRVVARLTHEFDSTSSTGEGTSALPLLSHLLFTMANRCTDDRLSLELYDEIGGIDAALEQAAEHSYLDLDDDDRRQCEQLFKSLVQLRDDNVPTRRPVELATYEATHDDADLDRVLQVFTANRTLTADLDTVTVSHEALISAWPRFRAWIAEVRNELEDERQLRAATRVWLDGGEDDHALLGGARLESAVELAASPRGSERLGDDARRFVQASERRAAHEQRARRRRTRIVSTLAVVASVAAVLAGTFAFSATRAADRAEAAQDEARSQQLALQSSVLRSTDPALSKQVAIVAYQTHPTPEALAALTDASAAPPTARYLGQAGPTALATTPDGRLVAYSDAVDATITVLSADGDVLERQYTLQHPNAEADIYALAFSPDGRWLASGGSDMYVTLWDLDGDRSPVTLDDSKTLFSLPVQSLLFDPSGTLLYGSGTGGGVGIWNVDANPESDSELIPVPGSTMGIALAPEQNLLAAGSWEGIVSLWSTETGDMIWSSEPDDSTINTVDVSPDGSFLAAGYKDGIVRVWDISDPAAPVELETGFEPFTSWVNSVRFSPDGELLVGGSSDSRIVAWDTSDWSVVGTIEEPTVITQIRFVSDDLAYVALADGSVRSAHFDDLSMQHLQGAVWRVSYAPDGTMFASSKTRVARWGPGEHERDIGDDIRPLDAPDGFSGVHALSRDGRWLAIGTRSGLIDLYDLSADEPEPIVLDGFIEWARSVAEEDTGNPSDDLRVLIESLAFDHQSAKLAVVGGENVAFVWELNDGDPSTYAELRVPGLLRGVGFSPTDDLLAVASDSTKTTLFDTSGATIEQIADVATGDSIAYGTSFHPSEPVLATSNADATLALWDITDPAAPERITTLTGPNSRVFDVIYSDDGTRMAAPVGDGTVWLWDSTAAREPELIGVMTLPSDGVYTVALSPDGDQLAAGGSDQRVFVWDLDPDRNIDTICATSGDQITAEEWQDYVPDLPYTPPCQ